MPKLSEIPLDKKIEDEKYRKELKELQNELISYIEEMEFDCTWNLYSMNSWIVKDLQDERVRREECIVEAKAKQGTVADIPVGAGVGKILCMCNPSRTVEIEEALKAKFPCLSIMRSSDILIEIIADESIHTGLLNYLFAKYKSE